MQIQDEKKRYNYRVMKNKLVIALTGLLLLVFLLFGCGNMTQQTSSPSFSISLSSNTLNTTSGHSSQTALTITPQNGFTGDVSLSLIQQNGDPAPSGLTLNPTRVNVTGSGPTSQALSISVAASVPVGTYQLKLKASSGGLVKEAALTLNVDAAPAPSFTISLDAENLRIQHGARAQAALTITPLNGFSCKVKLELSMQDGSPLPAGINFGPGSVAVSGNKPVKQPIDFSLSDSAIPGAYLLKLKASCGGLIQEKNFTLVIDNASSFTISFNPNHLSVDPGSKVVAAAIITPWNGFSDAVSLALTMADGSAAPSGIGLSPSSVTISGDASLVQPLTISVAASVPVGTYQLKLKASSGGLEQTADFTLTVGEGAPEPSFTLSLNPPALTVTQGQSAQTTLTLTPQNGFTGDVSLSLLRQDGSAAPSGLTLTPAQVSVAGSNIVEQNLTIIATTSATSGTYALSLKAVSGPIHKEISLTLTVAASQSASWQVSPSSLSFSGTVGGSAPPAQSFTLVNAGGVEGSYSISVDRPWISASPPSGTLSAGSSVSIQVFVDTCMAAGTDSGKLTVSGDGSTAQVEVTRVCAETQNSSPTVALKLQTYGDGQEAGVPCQSGDTTVAGYHEGHVLVTASDPDGDSITEYKFRIDGGDWSSTSSNEYYWYEPNNNPHAIDVQVVDSRGGLSSIATCVFRVSYTPEVVEYSGPNNTDISPSIQSFDAWVVDADFDYPETVFVEIYNEDTGDCLTNNGPWIPCGEDASRVSGWDSQSRVHYQYLVGSSWPSGRYSYRFTVIDSYGQSIYITPKKYFSAP